MSTPTITSTPTAHHGDESCHWYTRDGRPMHELPRADGKGMRPTTLRDARKLSLLPSVTTILNVLDKPALVRWKVRMGVLAVTTAPDVPGESLDAKIARVLDDEAQHEEIADAAADLGTRCHGAIARVLGGGKLAAEPPELAAIIAPAVVWFQDMAITPNLIEQTVVGEGYAGTVDLRGHGPEGTPVLIDWKSSGADKLPEGKSYPEHAMQVAAYVAAWGQAGSRAWVCYLSTKRPGEFSPCEVTDLAAHHENGFVPALHLWAYMKGYLPW